MIFSRLRNKIDLNSGNKNITFSEALKVWIKIAINSFGGPAGQIAVMHKILVEEKKWIDEHRFLHALNYCMLLPGPEAQQLVIYIGWLLHRIPGGIAAGVIFVLPGFISILVLSIVYTLYNNTGLIQGIFYGIKAAIIAIVIEAVIRIGKRSLKNNIMVLIALLAFTAIFFFSIPFPFIIITAGLIGFTGGKIFPDKFIILHNKPDVKNDDITDLLIFDSPLPTFFRSANVFLIGILLWFAPLLIIGLTSGAGTEFYTIGLFFSKAAVITFGGAYSVLVFIAQEAVNTYHWLNINQMMDGLGMAETTPGPLIQVVQFVGFLGAYNNPGTLNPLTAGILASLLTTWVTFVPSFLWIFLGAPYIEKLRGNKILSSSLSGITAAVVGVMLNLSLWFSIQTLFKKVDVKDFAGMKLLVPDPGSIDPVIAFITILSFVVLFKFKLGILKLIWISASAGLIYYFFYLTI